MLPIEKLIQSLTRDQVRAVLVRLAAQLKIPTTSWRVFGISHVILTLMAATIAPFTVMLALAVRGQFLDLAEGVWLTLLAKFVYGVERNEATFARESCLTLVNSEGGEFDEPAGALIVRNPTSGKLYKNANPIFLAPFATLEDVVLEALEVGAGSTSAPGTITELVTTWTGVTCTNPKAIVGRDQELDEPLRVRCRAKLGSLSPFGPRDAFRYVATSRDLHGVDVTRCEVEHDNTTGEVVVVVAGPGGAIAGDAEDLETDLGKVNDAVQRLAAPLMCSASTVSATPLDVPVAYAAWMSSLENVLPADAEAAIATRLATYFASIRIGGDKKPSDTGKVFVNALEGEIKKATPVFQVEVAGSNVAVGPREVPVLESVTGSVVVV
jgi:hypothetical protein